LGGTDQWGNITAGIELIGRREGGNAHGLVLPLLTTSSGAKFGKSEGGNVWLDPAKTSPYKFFQFWLNTEDADVERLLRFFTTVDLADIAGVIRQHLADPGKRAAQRFLARDVTARVHGTDTADRVIAASEILFGGAPLASADERILHVVAQEVPRCPIERARLESGLSVVDALVDSGLAASKAEARRGIQAQGFSINGQKIHQLDRAIGVDDLLVGRYVALQKGKKSYAFLDVRVATGSTA
jgi:tyrosyl-tRNA synthetase